MGKKIDFVLDALFFCHKIPERSFFYKGKQFPVCARCTGLGIGYISSLLVLIILGMFQLWIAFLLILPLAIDGTGQLFGKWKSNNIRRLLTGIPAGIGVSYLFYHFLKHGYKIGKHIGTLYFGG